MDTAQGTRPDDTVPSRLRVRTGGVAAWRFLIATVTWWVLDKAGSGWPIVVTILAAFGAVPGE